MRLILRGPGQPCGLGSRGEEAAPPQGGGDALTPDAGPPGPGCEEVDGVCVCLGFILPSKPGSGGPGGCPALWGPGSAGCRLCGLLFPAVGGHVPKGLRTSSQSLSSREGPHCLAGCPGAARRCSGHCLEHLVTCGGGPESGQPRAGRVPGLGGSEGAP